MLKLEIQKKYNLVTVQIVTEEGKVTRSMRVKCLNKQNRDEFIQKVKSFENQWHALQFAEFEGYLYE